MTDDELESLIQRYRPAAPAPALRGRIVQTARSHSRLMFVEGMAALLLIGMNLSMIAASVTRVLVTEIPSDPGRTQQLAMNIKRLELSLSPQDTQAMAAQLAAGERLIQVPIIHYPKNIPDNFGGNP